MSEYEEVVKLIIPEQPVVLGLKYQSFSEIISGCFFLGWGNGSESVTSTRSWQIVLDSTE